KIKEKIVDPESVEDPLAAAVLFGRVDSVKKAVGNVTCPEHGTPPVIVFAGRNIENLKCDVGGCCNNFLEGVEKMVDFLF
ncbi:MAG: hypothetical protein D3910_20240, partial [Candidatus Electrothrix sp. ATG2]|nr:hypothetical protein [Candidatus Electrothrix sp. ATG2]